MYGASLDDVQDLAAFAKAQNLNFQLLSDPDGSATAKYGVDTGRGFAKRVTFVIDPKGILRYVDEGVNVDSHGKDIIETVARLQLE